jgi:hypothetical protein
VPAGSIDRLEVEQIEERVERRLRNHGQGQEPEQVPAAADAQRLSHCVLQQNESNPHTQLWQDPLLHPGPDCAEQHVLGVVPPPPPQEQKPPQSDAASPAQTLSHWLSQQNGSRLQTQFWQVDTLHPGVPLAEQQSPLPPPPPPPPPQEHWPGQSDAASSAQVWSQDVSQQNESKAHTQLWQAATLHPGVPLSAQQSPEPPPPPPPPHEQTAPQSAAALSAQMLSHWLSQQNASRLQTQLWQAATLQPGVPLSAQQSPEPPPPPPPQAHWPGQSDAASSAQV